MKRLWIQWLIHQNLYFSFSFSQHKLLIFFPKCNKIPNSNHSNSDFHHLPFRECFTNFHTPFHVSHFTSLSHISSLPFSSNQIINRFVVHFAWEPIHRYATISLDSYKMFSPPFAFFSTSKFFALISFYSTVSHLPNALIASCLFRFPKIGS